MSRMREIRIDVEVHRAIEQKRRSFAESENDILRRLLIAVGGSEDKPVDASASTRQRARGYWTMEFRGRKEPAANLKDAYRKLLLALAGQDAGFLEKLGQERTRSRRYVARSATDLYANSPHLAQKHAQELVPGWMFDTNLSLDQVSRRARTAARLAGLRYGADVRILEGLKEV